MSTRYGCPVTPQAVQTQLLLYHGSPEEKWGGNELWAANWWCLVLLGSQGGSGVASPRSAIQVHCGKTKGCRISILCQQEPGLNETVWSGRKGGYSFWAQSWPGKMHFSFITLYLSFSIPSSWWIWCLPTQLGGSAVTCNEHLQVRSSLIYMSQHHTWSQLAALELCLSSPAQKAATCTFSKIFWKLCYSDSGSFFCWKWCNEMFLNHLVLDISNPTKWTTAFHTHCPNMILFVYI